MSDYATVPYDRYPFPYTHPDQLSVMGHLFGLETALPTACRVLELGCAEGANLLPMAAALPESTFVGVDLSAYNIGRAEAVRQYLGLDNARLIHANILDVDESYGTFDYIVAHGVFSWVDRDVQRATLEVLRRHLRPAGIGYVSFDALPGAAMRQALRQAFLWHCGHVADPSERVAQARAFLAFIAQHAPDTPYGATLRDHHEQISNLSDGVVMHGLLTDAYEPLYLSDLVGRAAQCDLQYLGDAILANMLPNRLGDEVAETVARISADVAQVEQYLDLIDGTAFHRSLFCRADIQPDRNLTWHDLVGVRITSPGVRTDDGRWAFPQGDVITVSPRLDRVFSLLQAAHPASLPFEAICEGVDATEEDRAAIGRALLLSVTRSQVRLTRWDRHLTGGSTLAFAYARAQAAAGEAGATNLWHRSLALTPVQRQVLARCDGRPLAEVRRGLLRVQADEALERLGRNGFLVDR